MTRRYHQQHLALPGFVCRAALMVIITVVSAAGAKAAPPEAPAVALVEEGNKAYQAGTYEAARDRYLEGIAKGADNAHVWYDLGNTYFRLGSFGQAIASYRRAELVRPRDPDIRANLSLARKRVTDRFSSDDELGLSVDQRFFRALPPISGAESHTLFLAIYAAGWFALLCGSVFGRRGATSFGLWTLAISAAAAILAFGTALDRTGERRLALGAESRASVPGVIISREARVHAGDGEQFQVIAVVHDGAELLTLDRRGEWVQILLPEDRRGWVKRSALELIERTSSGEHHID